MTTPTTADQLVLVDENDTPIGTAGKMETHTRARLHRAFSVVVFNPTGETLIQRRAAGKYHSAGLWSNTCCGHPAPNEPIAVAARRRLAEEMGFDCELREIFSFRYTARLDNGLAENEFDHVLLGDVTAISPRPEPAEVSAWKWISMHDLQLDMERHPDLYTHWFKLLQAELQSRVHRYQALEQGGTPANGGPTREDPKRKPNS